MSFLLFQQPLM